ncbi:MAG: membrane protease YdiL (CAAX protease family) [Celeribacter sp.]|jgi:membrane protease YdiL (CAAX protease family)
MKYNAYADMVASALRQRAYWRIAVVLGASFLVSALLTPLALGLIGALAPELMAIKRTSSGIEIGTSQGGLFVVLASFALLLGATVIFAKKFAERNLRDITGPAPILRAQFIVTLKWMAGLTAVMILVPSPHPAGDTGDMHENLALALWLAWLPLGLIGLAVQVTAEEMFFRGYLQTQLIGATQSYAKGMVLAALLFGIGHISTEIDGVAALFPIIWATLFGLVAGDLTARSGTIGPAIAVHLVNNMMAMFIAPVGGQLSGFGLWTRDIDLSTAYSDPVLVCFEGLILLITWLTARIALKR